MKQRIVVTGKKGQVVQCLLERSKNSVHVEVVPVGLPELDLADTEKIKGTVVNLRPDVIVSAAAFTAVDAAESCEDLASRINAMAVGEIGKAAAELDVPVIHLSTDYVFDGTLDRAYTESDEVGPVSAYGRTKLGGELALAAATENHVILRTAWVYSPYGKNFVKTMLELAKTRSEIGVVCDQIGCPTSAYDIADAILQIAENVCGSRQANLRGVFHLAGSGEASWAEFAQEIFQVSEDFGAQHAVVRPIPASDYPTPAKRPGNSRLNCAKLERTHGVRLTDWRHSNRVVLEKLILPN